MKLSLRKLSQKGFITHHIIIPAVVVVAGIGGVGAYVLSSSKAAASTTVSCTITKSPSYVTSGTTYSANISYKNTGSSSWSGSTTPKMSVIKPSTGSIVVSNTGSTVAVYKLSPGQTATRSVSLKIPTNSASNQLRISGMGTGATLASSCSQTFNIN